MRFVTDVLMLGEGDKVTVGSPNVEGATVAAEVVEQGRGPKILVFRKRRRQNFRRRRGHRQDLTVLKVTEILTDGKKPSKKAAKPEAVAPTEKPAAKTPAEKPAPEKKAAAPEKAPAKKAPAKKPADKKEPAKAEAKKAAAKKPAAKKAAPKKPAAKKTKE